VRERGACAHPSFHTRSANRKKQRTGINHPWAELSDKRTSGKSSVRKQKVKESHSQISETFLARRGTAGLFLGGGYPCCNNKERTLPTPSVGAPFLERGGDGRHKEEKGGLQVKRQYTLRQGLPKIIELNSKHPVAGEAYTL